MNKDKYICYCQKVTSEKFLKHIRKNNISDFNLACAETGAALTCSACLANLEDLFIMEIGEFNKNISLNKLRIKKSLINNLVDYIDALGGSTSFKLEGIVPIIYNKDVSTWLNLSNLYPKKLEQNKIPFKLICNIYDSNGKKIKYLKKTILPDTDVKICLSDYLSLDKNNLSSGSAHVMRYSNYNGPRGSTRPHFFYKSLGSMATLHTQDGSVSSLYLDIANCINSETRFLFIANMSNKINKIKWKINNPNHKNTQADSFGELIISANGSDLIVLPQNKTYESTTNYFIQASGSFKPYFIIASENFDNISVDHVG